MNSQALTIAGKTFESRLFVGTGKYASGETMRDSLAASGSQLVTMAMRRVQLEGQRDNILDFLPRDRYHLLPNTSGVRDAKEAIFAAELAREALCTNWLKLEIHPDPKYLLPDPVETLKAAEALVHAGFIVLPYVHADPVVCKKLEDVGVAAVMPLGAPIGSNQGLETRRFLEIIVAQSSVPVVVDAGLGVPSHGAEAMELGADAVLVNTALATAGDPIRMGIAFKLAVEAGRLAYESGRGRASHEAIASSPLTAFLDQ
ncbi:thiazole synthase [Pelagicoccus sp. SDUM812002]|uniref:thiazole synthase n=1 Tax=Pelagicoccus sp. SDUM812002 TaxID=3041266 RepID=UPI0028104E9C|nr:thiazole synthase [Pelagicoccus sp. SDUM812002]MDQ8184769.1 thiazole synthase [Pelagicoccus sp. SDUM812002]